MTTSFRSLFGIVFAALLAPSLIVTTQDAIAKTTGTNPLPALFDQGFVEHNKNWPAKPVGRLGVSWE